VHELEKQVSTPVFHPVFAPVCPCLDVWRLAAWPTVSHLGRCTKSVLSPRCKVSEGELDPSAKSGHRVLTRNDPFLTQNGSAKGVKIMRTTNRLDHLGPEDCSPQAACVPSSMAMLGGLLCHANRVTKLLCRNSSSLLRILGESGTARVCLARLSASTPGYVQCICVVGCWGSSLCRVR
jgi:hypothetical protein